MHEPPPLPAINLKESDVNKDDDDYVIYSSEEQSPATGWFVAIIVALALLAIGYLVFSADYGPEVTRIEATKP